MRAIKFATILLFIFSCQMGNQKQKNTEDTTVSEVIYEDTIHIGKMHCEMCVASIEKGITDMEGVEYVKAVLSDSIAVVRYNSSETSLDEIKKTVVKRGYTIKENVTNP
jgi:copper chaperone